MQSMSLEDSELKFDVKYIDGSTPITHDSEFLVELLRALRKQSGRLSEVEWDMVGANENLYDQNITFRDSREYNQRLTFSDVADGDPFIGITVGGFRLSEAASCRELRSLFINSHAKHKIASVKCTLK